MRIQKNFNDLTERYATDNQSYKHLEAFQSHDFSTIVNAFSTLEFVLCNLTECIFVDGIVFDFLFSEL